MPDTDWDEVWKERISKKFDVEDIEEQTDLKKFLDDKLEDTATITRWGQSHQVTVKPQLLENIIYAKGYQELQKVMETRLRSSRSLNKLQQEVALDSKAEKLVGIKIVKALQEEGKQQRALNFELLENIRSARKIDDLDKIRKRVEENRELLGRSTDSLLRIADSKQETF